MGTPSAPCRTSKFEPFSVGLKGSRRNCELQVAEWIVIPLVPPALHGANSKHLPSHKRSGKRRTRHQKGQIQRAKGALELQHFLGFLYTL